MFLKDFLNEKFYHVEFEIKLRVDEETEKKSNLIPVEIKQPYKLASYIAIDDHLTEYNVDYLTPWIATDDVEFDPQTGEFYLISFRRLKGYVRSITLRDGTLYYDRFNIDKMAMMETQRLLLELAPMLRYSLFEQNFNLREYLCKRVFEKYRWMKPTIIQEVVYRILQNRKLSENNQK